MSAAFHRDPPHHLCLDYHRRTTHRFTEPHRSSSTPHLLHRDRLPSQVRLISERINRGFAQTSTFHQSFHRPPTRTQPTSPSQLHITSDKHKK
ncbi:unnamed protein product [Brassica napus]|uniref:(rape) hypothetical protein n=1 Tax=Brassica napus TaxID=3708 RepID=A0A816JR38_BRANA|nr:unnamed protein product [Brassica napus]